jgi:Uma2 family endonuclease
MDTEIPFSSERRLTQRQFCRWVNRRPESDHHSYELIHGRIVMTPPADFFHGTIEAEIATRLANHARAFDLGRVLASSATYALPTGDTLEPDVSFISQERLAAGPRPVRGKSIRMVPDLAVEILSRPTAHRDRRVKRDIYAAAGVREYWVVDPERCTATVYRARRGAFDRGVTHTAGVLRSGVLRGLVVPLDDLFR